MDNSDSGDDETGCPNNIDLGPIEYPSDQHRLQYPYWLWYSRRPTPANRNLQPQGTQGYSQALRLVAQVGTVEQWWSLYSHIIRLNDLPVHTDLHLFKMGIQPMWEDQANAKGGKWVRPRNLQKYFLLFQAYIRTLLLVNFIFFYEKSYVIYALFASLIEYGFLMCVLATKFSKYKDILRIIELIRNNFLFKEYINFLDLIHFGALNLH